MKLLFATLLSIVLAHTGYAQHESPYTDLSDREIKALSQDEIDGLLEGAGMGMALPAELNGYPGPKHVLEMADELTLSDEQSAAIQAAFDSMAVEARRLGARIVELERELDSAFAAGTVSEDRLESLLEQIAAARGRLRFAHLKAHLAVTPLLTEQQRTHYRHTRGYGTHH